MLQKENVSLIKQYLYIFKVYYWKKDVVKTSHLNTVSQKIYHDKSWKNPKCCKVVFSILQLYFEPMFHQWQCCSLSRKIYFWEELFKTLSKRKWNGATHFQVLRFFQADSNEQFPGVNWLPTVAPKDPYDIFSTVSCIREVPTISFHRALRSIHIHYGFVKNSSMEI